MNCFNHSKNHAVGICKHCNKGICPDCLSDTGDGIACKGRCTEEVIEINKMIDHNKKVIKSASGSWMSAGMLLLSMGVIFLIVMVIFMRRIDPLLGSIGILFTIYGIYTLVKGRVFKNDKTDF